MLQAEGIRSVALPKLGYGLGGLDWNAVRPLIETILGDLEGWRWGYEGRRGSLMLNLFTNTTSCRKWERVSSSRLLG